MPRILLFLSFLLIAPAAQPYELTGYYWSSGSATFHTGIPGNSPSGESWQSAFTRAMDSWTEATVFQFNAVDQYLDPCAGRGDGNSSDDAVGIDFTADACGDSYGANVLAVTIQNGDCDDVDCNMVSFTDADIVFNEAEPWDVFAGPLPANNTIDFHRVALHELGHALGLGHEQNNDAIMQALVNDSNTLQLDDIDGTNIIYAGESNQNTVHGITVTLPQDSTLSGPSDSLDFSGSLDSDDDKFDNKFLDLYQYTFEYDSRVDILLDSSEMNPFLYLARISSTQDILGDWLFSDDNSGVGTNARLSNVDIQAGTYWIGVSSGSAGEQGSYSVSLNSSTSSEERSFSRMPSGFGLDVEINPNPNISGSLSQSDFVYEGKFIDLYQFDVLNPIDLRIDLRSAAFDTQLMLVDVLQGNVLGNLFLQNDDVTAGNSDSRLEETLQPGRYWIGVTSFENDEVGDYSISSTVVFP